MRGKNNRYFFLILLIVPVFAACKKGELSPEKYRAWVEDPDNGLIVSKEIDGYKFSVQYKPVEYTALIELGKEGLSEKNLTGEIETMSDMQYYTFRIERNDFNDELLKYGLREKEEYYARIEYFSFGMKDDLALLDGRDTVDCVLYHFERTYGAVPYINLLLAFSNPHGKAEGPEGKTLIYRDKIFGTGTVQLHIDKKNIVKIPELTID